MMTQIEASGDHLVVEAPEKLSWSIPTILSILLLRKVVKDTKQKEEMR